MCVYVYSPNLKNVFLKSLLGRFDIHPDLRTIIQSIFMFLDTESTAASMFTSAFSEENSKNDSICKNFIIYNLLIIN